jgi:hypothetical protein
MSAARPSTEDMEARRDEFKSLINEAAEVYVREMGKEPPLGRYVGTHSAEQFHRNVTEIIRRMGHKHLMLRVPRSFERVFHAYGFHTQSRDDLPMSAYEREYLSKVGPVVCVRREGDGWQAMSTDFPE